MTAELFKDQFFNHFLTAAKENLKRHGLPEDNKAVLKLGNCRACPSP
jgi:hypothetical protein